MLLQEELLLKPVCNYDPMCKLSHESLITGVPLVPSPKSLISELPSTLV